MKTRFIVLRVSETQRAKLWRLANRRGVTVSDLLREALRAQWAVIQ